jgi:iron complex outermembrane recepter protein
MILRRSSYCVEAGSPQKRRSHGDSWPILCSICATLLSGIAVEAIADDVPAKADSGSTSSPSKEGSAAFKKMSLDELMDIEVNSVSRRESTVGQSPAAITVITQDEIRRSGATSIAEALRLSPGLDVARIDNSTWAITSRGFNSGGANKILVLIDGRTVYTPLYSGVFWDVQDAFMQDIDRIEVIRGPAGALWGANAVNGVINVTTKHAKDTQGGLVFAGGGTEERLFSGARYGWMPFKDAYARAYIKQFDRDGTVFSGGSDAGDNHQQGQAGFRFDWDPSAGDRLSFHGDVYAGDRDNFARGVNPTGDDSELSGGNIVGVWARDLGTQGDFKFQVYYDRTYRNVPETFKESRNTFDLDFQHHIKVAERHDVTWGLGYRVTSDDVDNGVEIQFIPDHRTSDVYSAFIQDEIQLVPARLTLTLGAKFEHNDFTGFEVQPNARMLWSIDHRQSAWGAVSRAVRTPARLDNDLNFVTAGGTVIGNHDFKAEEVIAYEVGYRVQPASWLAFDIAGFFNVYDNLSSIDLTDAPGIYEVGNGLYGETYGLEFASTWTVTNWWTLRASYTFLDMQLHTHSSSLDIGSEINEGNSPENQVQLRSSMNLARNTELDINVRYVDNLPDQNINSYVAVDVRLGWRPTEHAELSVVGQNLFDNRHPEFGTGAARQEIERGVYAVFTYTW